MLLFDFFSKAVLALSIFSNGADRTRSGRSSALSHVKSSGIFFSIGKRLHWGKALPSAFQVLYRAPRECSEGNRGVQTPTQLLSPVLGQGQLDGLAASTTVRASERPSRTMLAMGWEVRDVTHHLHPPSRRCRTTSNKRLGGTGEGAHA